MNAENQLQMEDEDIEIEVPEDEDGTTNPNIQDQLDNAPPSSDESTETKRSAEERFEEFMESDEELKNYGSGVRKRIGTLTYNWREAERQRDEAIRFAQLQRQENENLKSRQYEQDGAYITEYKEKVEAKLDTAKRQLKEALEVNDPDLIAEANANIGRFAAELAKAEDTASRYERSRMQQPQRPQQQYPQQQYPQQQRRPAPPQPDEQAKAWAERNKWFGEDQIMTNAAMTIHQQLIVEEGYLPQSPEYYQEIDRRIRKNFPQKFQATSGSSSASVTPGDVGSQGRRRGAKRQVKLTASQVSIAKRLGVPLEEYAKYV